MKNFLFHRVNPVRDKHWDPMDVKLFDKTIQYLSKKYDVVLFEEFMKNKPSKNNNRLATIMFDDGYLDNLEYAAPILKKYNVKASFYVVTNCIEQNMPIWTYSLDRLIQDSQKSVIRISNNLLPKELQEIRLQSDNARKLKPFLKSLEHGDREVILTQVYEQLDDVQIKGLMMNWDQVRQLSSEGHHIGSHTVNHFMLGTINDKEILKRELLLSKEIIEKEIGKPPLTISYPIGSYNNTTIDMAKECGYQYGLAVKQTTWNIRDSAYEIPRIELYNESWLKTRLRASGYLTTLKNILKRK